MGFSPILVVNKLNEYNDGDEDLNFDFPFNVDFDQISRITPEDRPSPNEGQIVQLVSTVETLIPQEPERHAVLSPNGPEYEQARSALE